MLREMFDNDNNIDMQLAGVGRQMFNLESAVFSWFLVLQMYCFVIVGFCQFSTSLDRELAVLICLCDLRSKVRLKLKFVCKIHLFDWLLPSCDLWRMWNIDEREGRWNNIIKGLHNCKKRIQKLNENIDRIVKQRREFQHQQRQLISCKSKAIEEVSDDYAVLLSITLHRLAEWQIAAVSLWLGWNGASLDSAAFHNCLESNDISRNNSRFSIHNVDYQQ